IRYRNVTGVQTCALPISWTCLDEGDIVKHLALGQCSWADVRRAMPVWANAHLTWCLNAPDGVTSYRHDYGREIGIPSTGSYQCTIWLTGMMINHEFRSRASRNPCVPAGQRTIAISGQRPGLS